MRSNIPVQGDAHSYDHYTSSFLADYDRVFVNRVVEEYRERSERQRLVDIGTGTARILTQLAERPELRDLDLIGTEFFDDMVEAASETVRQCGLTSRIEIVYADVHAMPYQDGHFHYLISRSTLHHWAQPVTALREIHRILAPGGVGIIHDLRRDPDEKALEAFNEIRRNAGLGPTRIEEKYTVAEAKELLEEAGIWQDCSLFAPASGRGAVGYELTIRRR
jgi:ubiquinone/menaquinone biosynthesis C-methylase UbiE